MPDAATAAISHYLVTGVRTLYEACHGSGRDEGGSRCPACCVRDLCERRRNEPGARDCPDR